MSLDLRIAELSSLAGPAADGIVRGRITPALPVAAPVFATNAAAVAGGVAVGSFYRSGLDPDTISVVH